MKKFARRATVAGVWLAGVLLTGCSTPNVNPPAPRADTGYVDFYTDSNQELSWEVKRAKEPGGEMRTVFNEFKPLSENILRLATPAGRYRFEVGCLNQATTGPQSVTVQVENAQVTPVHVTLTPAGTTSVNEKIYGFRPSAKAYGRGTKVRTEHQQMFQIGLAPGTPETYQPKERMP